MIDYKITFESVYLEIIKIAPPSYNEEEFKKIELLISIVACYAIKLIKIEPF